MYIINLSQPTPLDVFEAVCSLLHRNTPLRNIDAIMETFESTILECKEKQTDFVEDVFRRFISCGRIDNIFSYYGAKRDYIKETIIFKQSSNWQINIIAKLLYRQYGGSKHEFLDWQIDKLLFANEIDVLEEYKLFCSETGRQYKLPDIFNKSSTLYSTRDPEEYWYKYLRK